MNSPGLTFFDWPLIQVYDWINFTPFLNVHTLFRPAELGMDGFPESKKNKKSKTGSVAQHKRATRDELGD